MFFDEIRKKYPAKEQDISQYSPLGLAYIGDNVYELFNRTFALSKGNRQVEKLHKECSSRARASFQAERALTLQDSLTEEEKAIYLRGRNAMVKTKAKNSSITEYHEATGLEAVIGYLFLKGNYERVLELMEKCFSETVGGENGKRV